MKFDILSVFTWMNNFLREADFEIHRASDKLHKRNNVEIKTFLVGFSIKVKYNIALYQMHMFNSQYFQNYYYVNNYFASYIACTRINAHAWLIGMG